MHTSLYIGKLGGLVSHYQEQTVPYLQCNFLAILHASPTGFMAAGKIVKALSLLKINVSL